MLKDLYSRHIICLGLIFAFLVNSLGIISTATAEPIWGAEGDLHLPAPGILVPLSPKFTLAYLKGIVIHPKDPLKFDFIIYKGDKPLSDSQKRKEYTKLTKYFLASLAIPDEDQWVNLSPYEKDRIIKDNFGKTVMGRDLLAQDYMLKQITASLIYPEDRLGKEFWNKVYAEAQKQYGTTNIPVNTFNKVWILPDDALIYEKGNTAYVLKNHLRVMLEEDYLALNKNVVPSPSVGRVREGEISQTISPPSLPHKGGGTHELASQIVRQIILPALEKEVNEGQNFAPLRQVYSGMLLATWFKRTLKQSLLSQVYANKAKLAGVSLPLVGRAREGDIESIYHQYLKAYKKGVFNFIKDDVDKYTNERIPRKYFSGGLKSYAMLSIPTTRSLTGNQAMNVEMDIRQEDSATVSFDAAHTLDGAMTPKMKGHVAALHLKEALTKKDFKIRLNDGSELPGVLDVKTIYQIDNETKMKVLVYPISMNSTDLEELKEKGFAHLSALRGWGQKLLLTPLPGTLGQVIITVNIDQHGDPVMIIEQNQSSHGLFQIKPREVFDDLMGWVPQIHNILISCALASGIRHIYAIPSHLIEMKMSVNVMGHLIRQIDSKNMERHYIFPYANRGRWRESTVPSSLYDVLSEGKGNVKVLEYIKGSNAAMLGEEGKVDAAMTRGGIDMNSANLAMIIKRDASTSLSTSGKGVPLPISQQDLAQLSNIEGLDPVIISIKPASQTALFAEFVVHP